ncbi:MULTISPECIES: alpha/beta hydrolase [Citrobacter]|uniref:alpha/beta hydrolase n=1 Tax=Citrobacter TaxID=544 RepID=UPI000E3C0254|nr:MULTISPECIES: alpha/beta hydrolase [Citrobacter]MBD0826527.1 alpha/beta hydrolase [Citrobacter sp. C1]RFU93256.1 alpha/beta hydrolase [Citrobacter gillenii]
MIELTRRKLVLGTLSTILVTAASRGFAAEMVSAVGKADFMSHVDPELRAAAKELMPLTETLSKMSASTLGQIRASLDKLSPAQDPSVKVTKRIVPGTGGQPGVVVYVINDKPGTRRPAILHTHGGGFVLGTVAQDVHRLQAMSIALDCVIVSVEYRLAPEVTYAGSVEDNYAALKWVFENADVLGVDTRRVAVMGESAGGGHAALLAIKARDRGEYPLAFQLLVYPMLDDRTGSVGNVPSHIGRIIWTPAANRFGWASFLGVQPGTAAVPRAAVPARTDDFTRLPPAYICVGSVDLFVEENIRYAGRLIDAGVPAELLVVPGGFHGFDLSSPDAQVVKTFNNAKLVALRKAFSIS